jgi:hypothetical protein
VLDFESRLLVDSTDERVVGPTHSIGSVPLLNGPGAQRPAGGNVPLTTANALSQKLPNSIGAPRSRSAAALG